MSNLWKILLDIGANPASRQTKPVRLDPADKQKYSVGPEIIPDDHAPNNCEEYVQDQVQGRQ